MTTQTVTVSENPSYPTLVDASPQNPLLIFNTSDNINVYVSEDVSFSPGNPDTVILRPLAYMIIIVPEYLATNGVANVAVQVIPGIGVGPSPIDIAASIALNSGLATAANQVTNISTIQGIGGQTSFTDMVGYQSGSVASAFISKAGISTAEDMLNANSGVTTELASILGTGAPGGLLGGVPLRNLYTNLYNNSGTIPGDFTATQIGGTYTITQPSFEGSIALINGVAGAALSCPTQIWFLWYDIAGDYVDVDSFIVYPAISTGANHIVGFKGPSKASTLQVWAENFNATSSNDVLYTLNVNTSSRIYDQFRCKTLSLPVLTGQTITFPSGIATATTMQSFNMAARVLIGATASSLAASGGSETYFLPLWSGKCFGMLSSNQEGSQVIITAPLDVEAGGYVVNTEWPTTDAGPVQPFEFALPNQQCIVEVVNRAAAVANVSINIVACDW